MAECHPVAYQWVTEARLKGAKVIHIDPRFTRTSATADKHIPIRAGSSAAPWASPPWAAPPWTTKRTT